jgi:hypothetical protein
MKNIFVGNLDVTMTETQLRAADGVARYRASRK